MSNGKFCVMFSDEGGKVLTDRVISWPKADDTVVPVITDINAPLRLSHKDASAYYASKGYMGKARLLQKDDGIYVWGFAKHGPLRRWRLRKLRQASFSPDWRKKGDKLVLVGISASWS